ncbi:DNA polymerase III subunit alpha [Morganella morganii]|nr:DNA polymerase III subunit alpha [Morganella morganii]
MVATNDVRFISSEDFDAHEIRVAIHDGYTLADPKRPKLYSPQQYLRSEDEMCELFADIPEALQNSVEIAKRCNVTIRLGEYFLPQFPTGDMSTEDYLVKRSKEGTGRSAWRSCSRIRKCVRSAARNMTSVWMLN